MPFSDLPRQLTEARDQQTATSEILQVISRSPTDVQPVFDTIIRSAVRLLGGFSGLVTQIIGDHVHLAALTSTNPSGDAAQKALWPKPVKEDVSVHGQVITALAPCFITDVESDRSVPPSEVAVARARGWRSIVAVPLLHDGRAIGSLAVTRSAPGAFAEGQVALLQTFADQAVIAIENVRLFTELEARNSDLTEALEQQTATSEILRVISSSPTDVQPVFEAIVRSAERLCGGQFSVLCLFDGALVHFVAHHNLGPEALAEAQRIWPTRPARTSGAGRAILERRVVQIHDIETDPEYGHRQLSRAVGHRSSIYVPMLKDGAPVGVIVVARVEPGQFADNHVTLLQTFADQAVIAIENVRLFNETKEALERQTATSEVLQVISRSPTDVQPVFEAIVRNASRLCDGEAALATRFDGRLVHLAAQYNLRPGTEDVLPRLFPRPPGREMAAGRAILTGATVHIPDVQADPDYDPGVARPQGLRSVLVVPMLREGKPIGSFGVSRARPGAFSESQIELLKTFADQAVIAIENVRLFKELEARTAALTRSVEQLTALGEVGRAVSSTLDLEIVLTTIVSRAVQLSGLDGGVVFEYDDGAEEFVQRAATETGGALAEARRAIQIRKGEGVVGRTAVTLEPVQVPDITIPGTYESRLRENLLESGIRSILAVPMVREGHLIGCLGVTRNQAGDFPPETIDLLRTFATQSALAIQNARLFQEVEDKGRELEAASRHKSEFLANMSHELRTPLNAIIGFSEVLSERMFGELNEKQDEYLKDIYSSGQHLLSLINDILDLSKVEAGRMELEVTDFDLPAAIDNALILVRERASRRGITLGRAIDERVGTVRGDERKVKQVLLNLLSNALKFTPEGGRIDVRAAMNEGMAEISVADSGVGIAPEDQEAIFEEFRQVGTADKKVEGTGRGLALSRKFIELHGGGIWVKSQLGEGSTFTFTLPVGHGE